MSAQRFLRSKRQRALLWYAQDGKCAICGVELPETWHADHKTPWKVTQTTNIHDMQALCPACNYDKGAKMLRRFQRTFLALIMQILDGSLTTKHLFGNVTTGGGKSFLVPLAMKLIPLYADKICVVTPRSSLAIQMDKLLHDERFIPLWQHRLSLWRLTKNMQNPSHNFPGYITTYDMIEQAPYLHQAEFERHRYILLLDEPHHIKDYLHAPDHPKLTRKRAFQPLIDQARLCIFMSGTYERHLPSETIAFLADYYQEVEGGISLQTPPEYTVTCTRREALLAGDIVALEFKFFDASAQWIHTDNEERLYNSWDDVPEEEQQAMRRVIVKTEFAKMMLYQMFEDWCAWKIEHPTACCMVIAPNGVVAKEYQKIMQEFSGMDIPLAYYEDTRSHEYIERFKREKMPHCDILITIAMAYEGLDVPHLTHIACLSIIRSKPWWEQAFGRGCRKAPGKDKAFIYVPDDPEMRAICEAIIAEQEAVQHMLDAREKGPGTDTTAVNGGTVPKDLLEIVPMRSQLGEERIIDSAHGEELSREDTAFWQEVMETHHIKGVSPLDMKRAVQAAHQNEKKRTPPPPMNTVTPYERLQRWSEYTEMYVRIAAPRYEKGSNVWKQMNSRLKDICGGVPREEWTEEQYMRAKEWLNSFCPLAKDEEPVL